MTVNDASDEYFSEQAYRTLHSYEFESGSKRYGGTSIREIVDGLTVEKLRKTKGTREPGITKLVEEFAMAGINIPEK